MSDEALVVPSAPALEADDGERTAERAEARRLMASGVVIGALDLVALGALGVSCPLCVVGAPALVGWGAYRWWKVRRVRGAPPER